MPATAFALHEVMQATAQRLTGRRALATRPMPGGASLRRYYRVQLDGPPGSLVVMELGEAPASEEATNQGAPASELPFINVLHYLARGEVAVPRLHLFDRAAGLLYLEDLGDATLESCVLHRDDAGRRPYYQLAINELVKLQQYAAAHPSGCIAFDRGFDFKLLKWELDHFREWGLEAGAGVTLSAAEAAELERQFEGIAERLAAETRGFVHRDFQSRNLMVLGADEHHHQDAGTPPQGGRPDGAQIRLIDFQDALLGTRAYDLVALLRDSYVVLSPALLDRLVADYAERSGVDAEAFRTLFDLQTVQRKLKDAGRFVFIDRVKKNPGFLQYVDGSQRYVAEALARLPELASLREILATHLPLFR